jgi:hypothetical protein
MATLVPVPAETHATTCASCGSALVADQRYCLECGAPSSPVRLAFLDVLEGDSRQVSAGSLALESRAGGLAPGDPLSASGWLRRNAGWLLLLSVLLLCLIAGLLIGHWATSKQTAGPSVVKVEGLGALPATAAPASTTPAATPSSSSKASAKEEAEAAKEAAKETKAEKAPPPAPKKVAPTTLQKLSKSTGKKHAEEVNALGAQPIETG